MRKGLPHVGEPWEERGALGGVVRRLLAARAPTTALSLLLVAPVSPLPLLGHAARHLAEAAPAV